MQDFSTFPVYLTGSDWSLVLSKGHSAPQKLEGILRRLEPLSLKHP